MICVVPCHDLCLPCLQFCSFAIQNYPQNRKTIFHACMHMCTCYTSDQLETIELNPWHKIVCTQQRQLIAMAASCTYSNPHALTSITAQWQLPSTVTPETIRQVPPHLALCALIHIHHHIHHCRVATAQHRNRARNHGISIPIIKWCVAKAPVLN